MYLKLLKEIRFGLSLQCCRRVRVSFCCGRSPHIYELSTMDLALITAAGQVWVTHTM